MDPGSGLPGSGSRLLKPGKGLLGPWPGLHRPSSGLPEPKSGLPGPFDLPSIQFNLFFLLRHILTTMVIGIDGNMEGTHQEGGLQ